MTKSKLKNFIQVMTVAVLEAGELAIAFQGKVPNIGKKVDLHPNDSELARRRAEAKTEIDDKVQEMLLQKIKQTLGTTGLTIDAEEDTPTKKVFHDVQSSITIVLDPIDGTMEYVNGHDNFSINVGLIDSGTMLTTLIYFPKWKKLYYLDENKKAYEVDYSQKLSINSKIEFVTPHQLQEKVVYTNSRVPDKIISQLEKNGLTVIRDDGKITWPAALLDCLSGKIGTCLFHTPQIRDILLGALIENLPTGYMGNWQGNKISWPQGGRVSRVMFGINKPPSGILKSVS